MPSKHKGFAPDGALNAKSSRANAAVEQRAFRTKKRGMCIKRRRHIFNTLKLDCRLYRGKSPFGNRVEVMTMHELAEANRQYRLNFIKAMDQGKDPILWTWRVVDNDVLKLALEKNLADIT